MTRQIEQLRLSTWLSVASTDRTLSVVRDADLLAEASKLDGCYCLKADLDGEVATKELVHGRYEDLVQVEWTSRTCKTTHLEDRPIFSRTCLTCTQRQEESRMRGHVFVVMLAYLIVMELKRCWCELNITVAEGISELSSLCAQRVTINTQATINQIPIPRLSAKQPLKAANVEMSAALPCTGTKVYTKKKWVEERKVR